MKVYIAGKITGRRRSEVLHDFETACAFIRSRGHTPVNPLELVDKDDDWITCMRKCIKVLINCRCLYAMKGWTESKGATIEVNIALALGMRIINHETEHTL